MAVSDSDSLPDSGKEVELPAFGSLCCFCEWNNGAEWEVSSILIAGYQCERIETGILDESRWTIHPKFLRCLKAK